MPLTFRKVPDPPLRGTASVRAALMSFSLRTIRGPLVKNALFLAVCLAPLVARAQDENLDETPGATQAIQERAYRMGFEIAGGMGTLPVDPYTKAIYGQGAVMIHFTDWLGWQIGRFGYDYNWASGLRQQLERDFAVNAHSFDQIQFFVGSDVMLTPFYGKSSVANRFVIHYEAYLLFGATVFKYLSFPSTNAAGMVTPAPLAIRPGVDLGGGVRVFLNKYVSVRAELIDDIVVGTKIGNVLAASLMLCLNVGFSD
jgi:outer membrane beta-barrel protein